MMSCETCLKDWVQVHRKAPFLSAELSPRGRKCAEVKNHVRVKWTIHQVGRSHLLTESSLGKNLPKRRNKIQGANEGHQNVVITKKYSLCKLLVLNPPCSQMHRQQNGHTPQQSSSLLRKCMRNLINGNLYHLNSAFPLLSSDTHAWWYL